MPQVEIIIPQMTEKKRVMKEPRQAKTQENSVINKRKVI